MVVRVPTINTGQDPGDRFPDVVADEVRELIGEHSDGWLINPFYRDPARIEVPLPRVMINNSTDPGDGTLRMVLFTPRADVTIDKILTTAWGGSTHTAAELCRVGIYHVDTPEGGLYPMACIARSAHAASRWEGEGVNEAAIVDDGGETPALIDAVTLEAGVRYGVALLSVGHTGTPGLAASGSFRPNELGPPVGFSMSSQTDLPASIPAGGYVEEWSVPWFGLHIADE